MLLAQLAGEALARSVGLPVPGPVIGMALMLGFLALRDRRPRGMPTPLVDGTLEGTGRGLLANLSLLFVPAGVGVFGRLDVILAHGLALALILVLSTLAALVATAATFLAVSRLAGRRPSAR